MEKELVGAASAVIGCVSVVPQIYKSWKTGSSKDISKTTICLIYASTTLGIIYGSLIGHLAVYIGNSVTLALYVALHAVKYRNERREWEQVLEPVGA